MENGVYMLISCCLIIQKFQLSNYCGLFTLWWWAQCLIIWPLMHVRSSAINPWYSIPASDSSRAELRERVGVAVVNVKQDDSTSEQTSSQALCHRRRPQQKTASPRAWKSVPSERKMRALSNETLRGLSQIDLCQPPLCSAGCVKHPEWLQVRCRKLACS